MGVTDSDFDNEIADGELLQGKGVRSTHVEAFKARDLELLALIENPAFSVYKDSTQPITGNIAVTWESEEFDKARSGQKFDFANDQFKPQVAGTYLIRSSLKLSLGPSATDVTISIRKNGTIVKSRVYTEMGTVPLTLFIEGMIPDMNGTTDGIDIHVSHDSTNDYTIDSVQAQTFFEGQRVVGLLL